MEKREQERLEEILAMCAQYEEQIDSENQINAVEPNTPLKPDNRNKKCSAPPQHLDLSHVFNFSDPVTSPPSQIPGMCRY